MTERSYWLAWQQIEGLGPQKLQSLVEEFGSLAAAWRATPVQLERVYGLGPVLFERIVQHRAKTDPLAQGLTWEEKYGPCWTPADSDYPQLLREIPDRPPVLYYRGHPLPQMPAIALVGTRDPSAYGLHWAKKLGSELARAGFLVVSGLASGIDAAAHEGALAAKGHTAAVLGCGVDRCYPPQNLAIYQAIRDRGLILSEHPLRTPPATANFPRRNRILAGMTQATIVIEAGERSGALITARLAVDYGRDVFALPGELGNSKSLGTLSLLDQGAQLIMGVEDLLRKLGQPPLPPQPTPIPEDLTPLEVTVLAELGPEPLPLELLIQRTNFGTGDLTAILLLLELKGLVVQLPGLRYQRG